MTEEERGIRGKEEWDIGERSRKAQEKFYLHLLVPLHNAWIEYSENRPCGLKL